MSNSFAVFTDGLDLGLISSLNSDNFTVKMFEPPTEVNDEVTNKAVVLAKSEMVLKLAKKKVEVYGQSSVSLDLDDVEVTDLCAGKDFSVLLSNNGKLFYGGKVASLGTYGHVQGAPEHSTHFSKFPGPLNTYLIHISMCKINFTNNCK